MPRAVSNLHSHTYGPYLQPFPQTSLDLQDSTLVHCRYHLVLTLQIMGQFQFSPESPKRILPYQHFVDKFFQDLCYFSGLIGGVGVYYSCGSSNPINNDHIHVLYRQQSFYLAPHPNWRGACRPVSMDNEGGFLGHIQVPQNCGADGLCAGPVSPCVEPQLHI